MHEIRVGLKPDGSGSFRLRKGDDLYYVHWKSVENIGAALSHLGVMAADPELSFTWYDAANLSAKMCVLRNKVGI